MSGCRLTLALLVGLTACSGPQTPAAGDRPAPVGKRAESAKSNYATHWDMLAKRLPTFERSVHVASAFTPRSEIGVVRILDRMQLPFIPANSVPEEFGVDLPMLAVVISGKGSVALLSGESWALAPGDVLLLPSDARGFFTCSGPLRAGPDSGLQLLTLRFAEPEAEFAPQRLGYESQFALLREDEEVHLASLGSAASLHVYSCGPKRASRGGDRPRDSGPATVGGLVTPRLQTRREKIVFFVLGQGRFGMASTGNQARAGSLFVVAPGSPYFYENMDEQEGSLALVLYTPPWSADDDDTQPYDPDALEADSDEANDPAK